MENCLAVIIDFLWIDIFKSEEGEKSKGISQEPKAKSEEGKAKKGKSQKAKAKREEGKGKKGKAKRH